MVLNAVPEEIAVIGVDNDPLLCSLTTPPLTSVIPNTHRTGYEAARLLDRLMSGERIAPKGSSSRRSESRRGNPPTCSRSLTAKSPSHSADFRSP